MKKALVVDDSRLARLALKRILVKNGLEVAEAEGVLDAEQWIEHHSLPDIVFMDIMMPELDGYDGLARLRAQPDTAQLPIIMYSGDISEDARLKARQKGATGYLPKPAEESRVVQLLQALSKKAEQEQSPVVEISPSAAPFTTSNDGVITLSMSNKAVDDAAELEKIAKEITAVEASMQAEPAVSAVANQAQTEHASATVNSGVNHQVLTELTMRLDLLENQQAHNADELASLRAENAAAKATAAAKAALSSRQEWVSRDAHEEEVHELREQLDRSDLQGKIALGLAGAAIIGLVLLMIF